MGAFLEGWRRVLRAPALTVFALAMTFLLALPLGMLMKGAKKVPRGTAFVMSGGQLYMVNASKMFDRAGNAMFGMF